MVQQTNISFKEKLWFDEKFQKDKANRKLSSVIGMLLQAHYNISDDDQTNLVDIEDKLLKINAEKASLLKEKDYLEKKEKEEKDRYIVLGGEDL